MPYLQVVQRGALMSTYPVVYPAPGYRVTYQAGLYQSLARQCRVLCLQRQPAFLVVYPEVYPEVGCRYPAPLVSVIYSRRYRRSIWVLVELAVQCYSTANSSSMCTLL